MLIYFFDQIIELWWTEEVTLEDDDFEEDLDEVRVPDIDDSVICKFDEQQYFAAVVTNIDPSTERYEVKWVDGSQESVHHRYAFQCRKKSNSKNLDKLSNFQVTTNSLSIYRPLPI